mmetsp:Transcript_32171/g.29077  ORF Transcript_32171/g.29077 Transcript_32171/m.29077 type:complete len:81 (-) Transcript_32171:123-365(-)
MWQNNQMYHMILMDVIMPLCDGYEATSSIRDAELKNGYPATYICGLSSNDDALTQEMCKKSGMDDFCRKPLDATKFNHLF